jgi:hypothetical protein
MRLVPDVHSVLVLALSGEVVMITSASIARDYVTEREAELRRSLVARARLREAMRGSAAPESISVARGRVVRPWGRRRLRVALAADVAASEQPC